MSDTTVLPRSGPVSELMPLADLMRDYRDGDEIGWQAEFDWLDSNRAGPIDLLTTSIQKVGIRSPILLGDDGRVWDGHHRIAVAHRLGLESVPVCRPEDFCGCDGVQSCPRCRLVNPHP